MSKKRQTGRGGMGSHKHYISGKNGKSPRLRHQLRREAEAHTPVTRRKSECKYSSVEEALKDR